MAASVEKTQRRPTRTGTGAEAARPTGSGEYAPGRPGRAATLQAIQDAADRSARLRPLQRLDAAANPAPPPNRTGLPDGLKAGAERLSGRSLDDVRVHRDSAEPAALGARAFARGTDIHVGPGQERSLPHETWHVVQQKEGRVRPDTLLDGQPVNTDAFLEREADHMGARAASMGPAVAEGGGAVDVAPPSPVSQRLAVAQMDWYEKVGDQVLKRPGSKPGGYRLVRDVKGPGGEAVFETREQRSTHVEKPKTYEEQVGALPAADSTASFMVDASLVRFSQDSIASTFKSDDPSTVGASIHDLARALERGSKTPADLPPIRVFLSVKGRLVSLDNRRLWCCREAGTQVKCVWATDEAISGEGFKFTSGKGHEGKTTIEVRK